MTMTARDYLIALAMAVLAAALAAAAEFILTTPAPAAWAGVTALVAAILGGKFLPRP